MILTPLIDIDNLNLSKFDETKGSQDKNKNLEDVGGIQLSNTMKNMDVGELRPM